MPRFDVYRNPNAAASHSLYLDVQSDLVQTVTRWCIPLKPIGPGNPVMATAQHVLTLAGGNWLMDTPNILAVPASILRTRVARLPSEDQMRVESAIDFMLRGY